MSPERFKEIRTHVLKLNQWQLAITLDTSDPVVCRMERGKQTISRKMAQRLLDLAGIQECPTCGQSMPDISAREEGRPMTKTDRCTRVEMAEGLQAQLTAAYISTKELADDMRATLHAIDAWADQLQVLMHQARALVAVLCDEGEDRR